jgi:CheY-like chemotaxis protein
MHWSRVGSGAWTDTTLVATNGQDALDLLHTHCAAAVLPTCPALILLDMTMLRRNGFEFMQAYAQHSPTETPAVVVIMPTTSLNSGDVARMQSLLIHGYLTKPPHPRFTRAKILQLLQEHFTST